MNAASGTVTIPRGGAAHVHQPSHRAILARVICPHCWHRFEIESILWVSQHTELLGDPVLGPDAASRFLPTRFTVEGDALDARGMRCQTLACPRCHLVIPRAWIETDPLFISIIGVPASGKSYFLTSMTWELRRLLADKFAVLFGDTDAATNRILNEYEELLFLQHDPAALVAIRKTEVQGVALYDQIRLGQQVVSLPRPFMFTFRPGANHPATTAVDKISRVLCLYDNAGESYDPGEDSASSPVTQHLARSRVLMFLYDPTQDARLRLKCHEVSQDPQLQGRSRRQETVFVETATRVRRYLGLSAHAKHQFPVVVVVPKADVWGPLIHLNLDTEPLLHQAKGGGGTLAVDTGRVEETSGKVRALLARFAPEFVAAVEDFSNHVVYIPVSALGTGPQQWPDRQGLFVRAGDIKPKWATVPMLYVFAKWGSGLIAGAGPSSAAHRPTAAPSRQ